MAIPFVDAGPAEFENFRADAFKRPKVEEFFAVIAEVAFGAVAGLHAVSADKEARACVSDHQMVADEIELVAIEAGSRGDVQAFSQLTIEDQVAQPLAGDQVIEAFGQTHTKEGCDGEGICAAVFQNHSFCHCPSFGPGALKEHF